jgi:Cysteine-rich secretory protein family
MNQITNLLLLLTISSLFLPATAIMYASGSTDTGGDDEATSDTGSTDTGDDMSDTGSTDTGEDMSDTGSTDTGGDDEATSDTGSTAISDILESASIDTGDNTSDTWYMKSNHALDGPPIVTNGTSDSGGPNNMTNATSNPLGSGGPNNMTNSGLRLEGNTTGNSTYPVYNSSRNDDIYYSGGGDLASMILAGHNRVRADVGVAPLVWNDSLAAEAQAWADHLAAEGRFYHDPNRTGGENLAARGSCAGFDPIGPNGTLICNPGRKPPAEMEEGWFSEMNNYHGQADAPTAGHYTQSVWSRTTSIGCGAVSNATVVQPTFSGANDILVCRYFPGGNSGGPPY